jgi:mono/diheme cytochrome c family protein
MPRAWWIRILIIAGLVLIALFAVRLHEAFGQAAPPSAVEDGSAGRRLAQSMCGDCHSIESKTDRIAIAPDFTEIAALPSTTALSLNVFLRSSHRTMPNFIIARADADLIVAYILSLKR